MQDLLKILYPPTCILCGAAGDRGLDICDGCRRDLPVLGVACARCALPLPETVLAGAPDGTLPQCGACRRKPPPFERIHAAFRYEQPVTALVSGLKFQRRLNTLRLAGQLLSEGLLQAGAERPDALVPVPLHRHRLRTRGYDQAAELARIIAERLQLPLLLHACERVRATSPQAELEAGARRKNLRGAFRAREELNGRHVAIVDDVVTTTSTVSEVAKVLRGAGAARVDVWCLARTP
jgi:ComF family protein